MHVGLLQTTTSKGEMRCACVSRRWLRSAETSLSKGCTLDISTCTMILAARLPATAQPPRFHDQDTMVPNTVAGATHAVPKNRQAEANEACRDTVPHALHRLEDADRSGDTEWQLHRGMHAPPSAQSCRLVPQCTSEECEMA